MYSGDKNTDKELLRTVNKRLSRSGGDRITATVQQGTVTITGNILYEAQRRPIVREISSIAGVRSVNDQIQLKPKIMQ